MNLYYHVVCTIIPNLELFGDKNIINVEDLDKRREMDRLKRLVETRSIVLLYRSTMSPWGIRVDMHRGIVFEEE